MNEWAQCKLCISVMILYHTSVLYKANFELLKTINLLQRLREEILTFYALILFLYEDPKILSGRILGYYNNTPMVRGPLRGTQRIFTLLWLWPSSLKTSLMNRRKSGILSLIV